MKSSPSEASSDDSTPRRANGGRANASHDAEDPRLLEAAVAFLIAVPLSVLWTWPLAATFRTHTHDTVDSRSQAWALDWVQRSLFGDLWNANVYWPEANTLTYSDSLVGLAVLLLPARWIGLSPAGVLNIGLLLAYASNFGAAYWLGRVVGVRRAAAVAVGAAFSFGPMSTYFAHHIHVVTSFGIAVAATLTIRLMRDGRSAWVGVPLLAACVAVQGTISVYALASALVAVTATALALLGRETLRQGAWSVAAAIVGVALVFPLYLPYLRARWATHDFRWGLADVAANGAAWLSVDGGVAVWRPVVGDPNYPIYSIAVFPGAVIVGVATFGLVRGWRRSTSRTRCAIALVVVGALLAAGGGPSGYRRHLPFALLFEHVPGADAIRAPGRFAVVVLLGLALLVGEGATALARSSRPVVRWLVPIAIAVCIAVEGVGPWSEPAPVVVTAADRFLGEQRDNRAVLYVPLHDGTDADAYERQAEFVYRSTAHGHPVVNGQSSWIPPDSVRRARAIGALEKQDLRRCLAELGVGWVIAPSSDDDFRRVGEIAFRSRDEIVVHLQSPEIGRRAARTSAVKSCHRMA